MIPALAQCRTSFRADAGSGDMIEGTITPKLLERIDKRSIESRRVTMFLG